MLNWANTFLDRCLAGIPEGRYERRLRKELEGHLAALEADLTAAGCAPEEARAEAVRRMGDPAALNESYRAEWRRKPERVLAAIRQGVLDFEFCLGSSVVAGICYIAAYMATSAMGVTYDAIIPGRRCIPLLGADPRPRLVFGVVLFLCAYLTDAALLRYIFRGRKRKRLLITLGLLLTWVCEKGSILLISRLIYGSLPLPELMIRIAYGGDQAAPWFKYYYLTWTFYACFPLGWLFGWGGRKKRRQDGELQQGHFDP